MPNEASRPLPLQYPAIPAYCIYHRVSLANPCAEFRTWGADLDFTHILFILIYFILIFFIFFGINTLFIQVSLSSGITSLIWPYPAYLANWTPVRSSAIAPLLIYST